jgi:DNA-binding NtrC family response regulator
LVPVNCGAIPSELIESDLFGHTKGAYTTAHFSREGMIAAAEGGTLFLDEIDSLPLSLQSKLLRFLQDKEFRPIGSNALRRANVRIITASNADLPSLVGAGRFRQDLFFRINVLSLRLPPLRERKEDIPALAMYFVRRYAAEFKKSTQGLTAAAQRCLHNHLWPGNVRELSHTIERGMLLCHGPLLTPADFDLGYDDSVEDDASFQTAKARVIKQFERGYVEQVLAACDGNISRAAKAAKKNRRAFWELIRKYGIEPGRFRSSSM